MKARLGTLIFALAASLYGALIIAAQLPALEKWGAEPYVLWAIAFGIYCLAVAPASLWYPKASSSLLLGVLAGVALDVVLRKWGF